MYVQGVVSVTFEAQDPVEYNMAVQFDDTTGKLVPCADATKFTGIAIPNLEPDLATLRATPTTGPLVVVHKGYIKVPLPAGTYIKGAGLTIDTTNPGRLKLAGDTDVIVARVAEDCGTIADEEEVLIFIP